MLTAYEHATWVDEYECPRFELVDARRAGVARGLYKVVDA